MDGTGLTETQSIQDLAKIIKMDLEALPPIRSSASIYRVPKEIREGNEQYFTPRTVSVGPLHAGVPSLHAAEDVKNRYLNSFLSRLPVGTNLERIVGVLHALETRARDWYAEKISLSSHQFVKLMLLDGCFILQLLWRHEHKQEHDRDDPIFHRGRARWAMLYNLQQDLLLLENQLPFFVLCSLYELVSPGQDDPRQNLAQSALNFFDSIAPIDKPIHLSKIDTQPKHLLDLVMLSLFPRPSKSRTSKMNVNVPENSVDVRSASELEVYGVKFTKSTNFSYLTDITFGDGVLSIPSVVLLDSTASLFWNLLALEQCSDYEEYGYVFISYVSFMDNLICNNKDVDIFIRTEMLQSWVNDEREFLLLFNRLALAADMSGVSHFSKISQQLERYCDSGLHPLRAYLVRNYYEARWDVLNSGLLFILTVTQTLFAVLEYYGKGKN